MIRYPWMVFQDTASENLEKIPLNGNVQIIDAGGGKPKYITVIDITNLGTGINTIAQLLAATSQWLEISVPEVGGIEFNSGNAYVIGDIVSNTGKSYRCKTAGTGTWVASEWEPLEIGGVAWDSTTTYTIGDVIVHSDISYMSRSVNTNKTPSSSTANWRPVYRSTVWLANVAYLIGDLVAHNSKMYRAITNHNNSAPSSTSTAWTVVSEEIGGKLYNTGENYVIGDVVTYTAGVAGTEGLYRCKIDSPAGSWVAGRWEEQEEQGGIIFNTVTDYKVGDIVTKDNTATSKVYRCITDTTAGAMDPLEWNQLSEQGGVEWDIGTYYNKGDMVTDSRAVPVKTYFALADNSNVDPLASPATWQELNSVFYNSTTGGDKNGDGTLDLSDGGVAGDGGGQHCPWKIGTGTPLTAAWNSGTAYAIGDEVNYNGWKYTCLVANTGDDPVAVPTSWRVTSADGHPDAGNALANTLGEYPNTQVNGPGTEKIGATWFISGLGFTKDGEKYKYTMTGGDLVGIEVKDGDRITWVDGVHGSEIWFFSPAPEVSGERGGLAWSSGKTYLIGDVVGGSDGKQYTAVWQSAGMDPVDQPTMEWAWSCTTEGGGLMWDSAKTYSKGSIVSIIETYPSGITMVEQYLATQDGIKTVAPSVGDGTAPPVEDATGKWAKYEVVKYTSKNLTFSIGAGHDFEELDIALKFISRFVAVDGAEINFEIQPGYVINHSSIFYNTNFPNVTIRTKNSGDALKINLVGVWDSNTNLLEFDNCRGLTFRCNIDIYGTLSNTPVWDVYKTVFRTYGNSNINFDAHTSGSRSLINITYNVQGQTYPTVIFGNGGKMNQLDITVSGSNSHSYLAYPDETENSTFSSSIITSNTDGIVLSSVSIVSAVTLNATNSAVGVQVWKKYTYFSGSNLKRKGSEDPLDIRITDGGIAAGRNTTGGCNISLGATTDQGTNIIEDLQGSIVRHSLSLQNGWQNYGGSFGSLEYCKLNGIVYISGLIKSGSLTSLIATLPIYYRPGNSIISMQSCSGSTGRIDIGTNGAISANNIPSNGYVSMDISFVAMN